MSQVFSASIDNLFAHRITVSTERLLLDRITEGDHGDIWEIFGNEMVTQFTDFSTRTSLDDCLMVVDYFLRCYDNNEQYRFAIRMSSTNELIGTLGLFSIDEDSARVEIGYEIKEKYWRNGYMKEALSGFLGLFFTEMDGHRIEAVLTPGNTGSERLLESCGFKREGLFRKRDYFKGSYWDGIIYGIIREDYEEA